MPNLKTPESAAATIRTLHEALGRCLELASVPERLWRDADYEEHKRLRAVYDQTKTQA